MRNLILLSVLLSLFPAAPVYGQADLEIPMGQYRCLNKSGKPSGYSFNLFEDGDYINSQGQSGSYTFYTNQEDDAVRIRWQGGRHSTFDDTVVVTRDNRPAILLRISNRPGGVLCPKT